MSILPLYFNPWRGTWNYHGGRKNQTPSSEKRWEVSPIPLSRAKEREESLSMSGVKEYIHMLVSLCLSFCSSPFIRLEATPHTLERWLTVSEEWRGLKGLSKRRKEEPSALWKAAKKSLQQQHCPTPFTETDTKEAFIKETKASVFEGVSQQWYTVRIVKPCRKRASLHSPAPSLLSAFPSAGMPLSYLSGTQQSNRDLVRGTAEEREAPQIQCVRYCNHLTRKGGPRGHREAG